MFLRQVIRLRNSEVFVKDFICVCRSVCAVMFLFIAFATCDPIGEPKDEAKLKCFESYLHSKNLFSANVSESNSCDEIIKVEIAAEYAAILEKLRQDLGKTVSNCVAENAKKLQLHLASMKIYVYQHTKKIEPLGRLVLYNDALFEKAQVWKF